jgi:hypothetical protein
MKKSELKQIIKEEISKIVNENKNLITFKQLIDKGDIKKAARLYYGTGAITGREAIEALKYIKLKGLKKQFDNLDPDFDPAGGRGLSSHI